MPRKKAGRQTKKQIEAKARLKRILMENPDITYDQLKEMDPEIFELLSPKQILGMIGYLASPISKAIEGKPPGEATRTEPRLPGLPTGEGEEKRLPPGSLPPKPPGSEVREVGAETSESEPTSREVGDTLIPPSEVEGVAHRAMGREIEVMISPVIRKVVLDWRILGYLDYARAEWYLGDDYDLGDFLVDCVKIAMQKGAGVGIEFVKRKRAD